MRTTLNPYRVTIQQATGERYRRVMTAATGRDARIAAKRQARKGETVLAVQPLATETRQVRL